MKKRVFEMKSLLLLLLLIVAVNFSLSAQDAMKEYSESYDVSKGVTLNSDTKYSDVELITWDQNVVDIHAVVEVDASSQSRAEEALKKVDIRISKSGNNIYLETEMENGWSRNVRTSIEITIKAPAWMNLDMENSYGDLFIQEATGQVMLDLKYGNLKAGTISRGNEKPYNEIDMAYSNGVIDEAGWINLDVAYSDMEVGHSDMLFVDSKYSKLLGEKAGGIVTEGMYDKYTFDEVDSFVGELKYSGVKFDRLNKTFSLESSYTGVKIGTLTSGFDKVDAELAYGNMNVGLDQAATFKFEGEARYGSVSISAGDKMSRTKENNYVRVWGNVGSNPKSSIHVVTKYGNSSFE
jgi:hypothetical protein